MDRTADPAGGILFIGDIVAGPGRRALAALLPALRERYAPRWVVANGENAAGGVGITPKLARELFALGVDAITLGNHAYRHREVYGYLDEEPRIVRPANFLPSQPGHGTCVVEQDGAKLGVVSISGNLFIDASLPMFATCETAVADLERQGCDHILVDVHAEATSEKVALGWALDGRVTAVLGTHTHVPTADARVLPGGTAYITDVGMTGSRNGVIGVLREQAIAAIRTKMPVRFEGAEGDAWVMGAFVRTGPEPRRATGIEPVLEPAPDTGRAGRA